MKVLLMQQKRVGDVLTSTVLAEPILRRVPGAEVHFCCHDGAAPVLAANPHIARVHAYPAPPSVRRHLALAGRLRRERFDVVIDIHAKWESLILTALVRAPRRIGYRKSYTRVVYTDAVPRRAVSEHGLPLSIENRLRLLEPLLGPPDAATLAGRPRLYVQPDERERARAFLAAHGMTTTLRGGHGRPRLMVAALGSEPDKTYPLPAMASLLDHVVARSDADLLFNYLPAQRPQAEHLFSLCAPATRRRIALDAFVPGLRDFIAVLAECDGLFGNEGGAIHMARALDVPSLAVFSPWIERAAWASGDPRHGAVHVEDVDPVLVAGRSSAQLRADSDALYARLTPAAVTPALDAFVDRLADPAARRP